MGSERCIRDSLGSELTDAGTETLMDQGFAIATDIGPEGIGVSEIISPESLAGSGDLFSSLGSGVNPTWLEWSSTLNQSSDLYRDILRSNMNIQYDYVNPKQDTSIFPNQKSERQRHRHGRF